MVGGHARGVGPFMIRCTFLPRNCERICEGEGSFGCMGLQTYASILYSPNRVHCGILRDVRGFSGWLYNWDSQGPVCEDVGCGLNWDRQRHCAG